MRFSFVFLAASAFIAAWAQPKFTNSEFGTLTAGKAFTLTWSNAQGPVTITLKNGNPGALQTVMTVASDLTGTSFSWTPSVSLADGTYALEIDDSSNVPNFSPEFQLSGGSGTVTSVSSAGSTSSGVPSLNTSSVAPTTSSRSSVKTTSSAALTSSARPSVRNGTASTTTSSTASSAASSHSSSSSPTSPPNNSSAAGIASPLALVFLAFAALLTLS